MIPYMVGKLAPNSSRLTRGLVKYVPGGDYFRAVPSQNGDKFVTSPPPPPQSSNGSTLLVDSTPDGIMRAVVICLLATGVLPKAPTISPDWGQEGLSCEAFDKIQMGE